MDSIEKDIGRIAKKLKLQEFVCGIYFRDLTRVNDDFEDIWQRIRGLAPQQSQWGLEIPAHWVQMERNLHQLAIEGISVIKYKDLLDLASSSSCSPSLFVKYMKKSGLILTIKPDNFVADDEIVVDPQWLIDAFKEVIGFDDPLHPAIGKVRRIAAGELSDEVAQKVWKDDRFRYKIPTLLTFMENVGLLAKPRNGNIYFIPNLMDSYVDKNEIKKWLNKKRRFVSKTLVLDFRKDDIQVPFPHFDKLMAEFVSRQTKESLMRFQRYLCIVTMDNEPLGFVLCHSSSVVKVTLFTKTIANTEKKQMLSGVFGNRLLQTIVDISQDIRRRFNQQLQDTPKLGLSCNPLCPQENKPIAYREIYQLKNEHVNCCKEAHCKFVGQTDLQAWGLGKYYTLILLSNSIKRIFMNKKSSVIALILIKADAHSYKLTFYSAAS